MGGVPQLRFFWIFCPVGIGIAVAQPGYLPVVPCHRGTVLRSNPRDLPSSACAACRSHPSRSAIPQLGAGQSWSWFPDDWTAEIGSNSFVSPQMCAHTVFIYICIYIYMCIYIGYNMSDLYQHIVEKTKTNVDLNNIDLNEYRSKYIDPNLL